MSDEEENQTPPISSTNADASHTSTNMNDDDQGSTTTNSTEMVNRVQTRLWCSSVFTFINTELLALFASLSDADLLKVKTFLAHTLSPCTGNESSVLGQFLFHNTLSIAAKLVLPVLESAVNNPGYNDIQKLQLSNEISRLKAQPDIDSLVQGWKDKRSAAGGIGVVDGRRVYGPRQPTEVEDLQLAPTSYVGLGGLNAYQRVMQMEQ